MGIRLTAVLTKAPSYKRTIHQEKAPGSTRPLYLGSSLDGVTIPVEIVIHGDTAADAIAYVENTLTGLFESNEEIEFGPTGDVVVPGITIRGKLESMQYSLKPGSYIQRVQFQLKTGLQEV